MRTTLTIEEDVAVRLDKALATRETSLKALINDALRRGLDDMERPAEPRVAYVLSTGDLGECLVPSRSSVAEGLTPGEGQALRWLCAVSARWCVSWIGGLRNTNGHVPGSRLVSTTERGSGSPGRARWHSCVSCRISGSSSELYPWMWRGVRWRSG